jgi:hypothetical protein
VCKHLAQGQVLAADQGSPEQDVAPGKPDLLTPPGQGLQLGLGLLLVPPGLKLPTGQGAQAPPPEALLHPVPGGQTSTAWQGLQRGCVGEWVGAGEGGEGMPSIHPGG